MKTFLKWQEDFFQAEPRNRELSDEEIRRKFNEYIKQGLSSSNAESLKEQNEKYSEWIKSVTHGLLQSGFSCLDASDLDELYLIYQLMMNGGDLNEEQKRLMAIALKRLILKVGGLFWLRVEKSMSAIHMKI